jgi:hypothetical protein
MSHYLNGKTVCYSHAPEVYSYVAGNIEVFIDNAENDCIFALIETAPKEWLVGIFFNQD